jgi:hypothetical protein
VASDLVGLPSGAGGPELEHTTLYAGSVGRGMFRREHTGSIEDIPWIEKNSGLTALK